MKRILFLAAIIALTLSIGCKDETTTPTPNPNLALTPKLAVENFTKSFDPNALDIELYKTTLAEDYKFYFNPTDVGTTIDGYTIPEYWTYETDWRAMDNMFTIAYSVNFDIASSQIGTPEEGATEYTQENVIVSLLVMVDESSGFKAEGFVTFKFVKINENGEDVWKIKDMEDHTTAKKGIESSSLGGIKAVYYEKGGGGK